MHKLHNAIFGLFGIRISEKIIENFDLFADYGPILLDWIRFRPEEEIHLEIVFEAIWI